MILSYIVIHLKQKNKQTKSLTKKYIIPKGKRKNKTKTRKIKGIFNIF
jgi:hypothetical protein